MFCFGHHYSQVRTKIRAKLVLKLQDAIRSGRNISFSKQRQGFLFHLHFHEFPLNRTEKQQILDVLEL